MEKTKEEILLVNFGGPRSLKEIRSFLTELLLDPDVVKPVLPPRLHETLFRKIAEKRSLSLAEDYALIGGKSPIYSDTESVAQKLREALQTNVWTFHRYLPETHAASLQQIEQTQAKRLIVFPLFPQFTYATTGSIARFFQKNLSQKTLHQLHWISQYFVHPSFIEAFQRKIKSFLKDECLAEEETFLLFSAHGLPASFIARGDPYQTQCEQSFQAILSAFPNIKAKLTYQSKFGPGKWITPYTGKTSANILQFHEKRKHVVVVPLSFTSDHIETLFEVESQYLPLIRKKGLSAYRCPALNLESYWIESICSIVQDRTLVHETTSALIACP